MRRAPSESVRGGRRTRSLAEIPTFIFCQFSFFSQVAEASRLSCSTHVPTVQRRIPPPDPTESKTKISCMLSSCSRSSVATSQPTELINPV